MLGKSLEKGPEIQLSKELGEFLVFREPSFEVIEGYLDRYVVIETDQSLAEIGLVLEFIEPVLERGLGDLVNILEEVFYGVELLYEGEGCFFPESPERAISSMICSGSSP